MLDIEVLSKIMLLEGESRALVGLQVPFEGKGRWWICSYLIDDEWDEEVLEDPEVIRRMVIVYSNLDEIGWVKFWEWIEDLGYRLGFSRNNFIDDLVEEGWNE